MSSSWNIQSITELVDFNPPRLIQRGKVAPFIDMAALPVNAREISEIGEREFKGSGSKFQNGDTLFARITPCLENGKTAKVSSLQNGEIAHGSTEFIVMAAKDSIHDEDFVYYIARSPDFRSFAQARMEGTSGRQRVPWQSLAMYELPIPPENVRKEIGVTLRCLDDKIELNRQINRTLEEMAQAIFKSWFVDFDPVKAKMAAIENGEDPERAAMRAISGKSYEELDALPREQLDQLAATAALFPSTLIDSPLGPIPEGWEEKQIQDVAKVIKGKSYKSSELAESQTALVTLKSFNRGGGYRLDGLKEYTGAYKPEQEVFAGDLIVAYTDVTQAADVIGKPAMVISDSRYAHLVISLDVAVVRPVQDAMKYFLYGLATTNDFQQHTRAHSTGTTVLHLSKDAVPEYVFFKPSDQLITEYKKMVEPMFKSINERIEENSSLEATRDLILPKLLSGELEVAHAD